MQCLKCLKNERPLCLNFGWIYESKLNLIGMEKYVSDKTPKKSFVEEFPNLVDELHGKLNVGVAINSLSHGSQPILWWDCLKDITNPQ